MVLRIGHIYEGYRIYSDPYPGMHNLGTMVTKQARSFGTRPPFISHELQTVLCRESMNTERRHIMDIKTLYSKKTKAKIKVALCMLFFPDPGLIVEGVYEVNSIDNQIKKMVLEKENQPIVIVCPKDECKER